MEYYSVAPYSDELYHWGVKGMKWGVRRYQNKDGSLTDAGKKRAETYRQKELTRLDKTYDTSRLDKRIHKNAQKINNKISGESPNSKRLNKLVEKAKRDSFEYYYKLGMKAVETSKLNNMTLKEVDVERMNVGIAKTSNVLNAVGMVAMSALSPVGVGVGRFVDTTEFRTDLRVTGNDHERVLSNARTEASGDVESMLETGFDNIGRENPRKWKRPT